MSGRMAGEYIGRTNGWRGKTALRCIFMIDRRRKIWYIKSVMNIVMLISLEIINKNNRDYC